MRWIAGLASCYYDPARRVTVAESGGSGVAGRWSYCFTSFMIMKLAGMRAQGGPGPDTLSGMVHSGYLGLGWFFRREVGVARLAGKDGRKSASTVEVAGRYGNEWLEVASRASASIDSRLQQPPSGRILSGVR